MDDNALHIRTAHLSDAPALRAIYAPYVEKTAITFECTVPDVEEFAAVENARQLFAIEISYLIYRIKASKTPGIPAYEISGRFSSLLS